MSAIYNFTNSGSKRRALEQGATFSRTLTYKVDEDTAVNLTGYTARMKVSRDSNSIVVMSLTTENGGITLGGVAGTIVLAKSASDTADLPPGEYIYDLELVSAGGVVTRLLEGAFHITEEITK